MSNPTFLTPPPALTLPVAMLWQYKLSSALLYFWKYVFVQIPIIRKKPKYD